MTNVPRRIHILGTGSIGKLVAHSLAGLTNPPPVTLMFHRYRMLQAWNESKKQIVLRTHGSNVSRQGFDVELVPAVRREHGRVMEEVPQPDAPPSNDPIHSLIVTVKAPYTISALLPIAHRLLPTSTICFLQNGMGVIDDVNRELFPDPLTRPNYIQGVITHGVHQPPAQANDPFYAVHAGHGTIALGVLPRQAPIQNNSHDASIAVANDSSPTPAAAAAATSTDIKDTVLFQQTSRYLLRSLTRAPVLSAVGFPPVDLLQHQLEKLAVNAVINPLTVLLDAPNGSLLYNYALTRTMRLLLAEISLVLRSLPELKGLPNVNTRFSPDRLETLVVSVAGTTGNNISSMLADVRAGRQTEVRSINGYIVRRGEELGVQCVCNYMMMQLVEGKHALVEREMQDSVPIGTSDLTGER